LSAIPYDFLLPEVRVVVNELAARGIDSDLAVAYLEATCGEETLYDEPMSPDETPRPVK
jgi:hypothetical protein